VRGRGSEVGGQEGSVPADIPDPRSPFTGPVVLASRSPRRLELLSLLVPRERIRVVPPPSSEEAGFEGLRSRHEIEARLRSIAAAKCDAVRGRLGPEAGNAIIVAADTVIVVTAPPSSLDSRLSTLDSLLVLGQPPESDWRETTRRWFVDYYAGRTHSALTGLCVEGPGGRSEAITETFVTFRRNLESDLDWYLGTEEPRGKAGGYAIQGLGSAFVERVEGSLTNVVGLPLRELRSAMRGVVGRPSFFDPVDGVPLPK